MGPLLATAPPVGPTTFPSVLLADMPFVAQKPDFCGEACLEMAARRLGFAWDQDDAFAASQTDPALGRGATTRELDVAARSMGFFTGNIWGAAQPNAPRAGLDAAFSALHADLTRGVPSIVCMHFDESPRTTEHFRLVIGYDASSDEIVYHDPAFADGSGRRMSRERLFGLWPLKYESTRWLLVRVALEPRAVAAPPAKPSGRSPADYAQFVLALRERLEGLGLHGMSFRIEAPFVVTGDDEPAVLAERAKIVRWAADMLEKDFFRTRPKKLLTVYLFKNAASYGRGVAALTSNAPDTPYGFYSPSADGLFMNISTGGGTLVHEIVHPYVEADFPDAPAWLNEGLGSLFEQSAERDGHIVGLTNWRLAGLQKAIRRGTVPSFEKLAKMSDRAFYEEDTGTNYAQARYLFYYMQETGTLRPFYEAFRARRLKDRSGYATLVQALLGKTNGTDRDMQDFKSKWETYVAALRFPG